MSDKDIVNAPNVINMTDRPRELAMDVAALAEESTAEEDPADAATDAARLNEKVASDNKEKRKDEQLKFLSLKKRNTKCSCDCEINCDCKCTCACRDHCVCWIEPCEGKCGGRKTRNLVISIDGTSNQFGIYVSKTSCQSREFVLTLLRIPT
jgi:hypothetical protein